VNGPDGAWIARQYRDLHPKKNKKPQNELKLLNNVRAKEAQPFYYGLTYFIMK
jgi:hypothetical protein